MAETIIVELELGLTFLDVAMLLKRRALLAQRLRGIIESDRL
jgi:hypothetical protein